MRFIDADALRVQIHNRCDVCNDKNTAWCEHCCSVNDWKDYIDNAPTIEEQPTGKWIEHSTYKGVLICSHCHQGSNRFYDTFEFCPNCGAKMIKEE